MEVVEPAIGARTGVCMGMGGAMMGALATVAVGAGAEAGVWVRWVGAGVSGADIGVVAGAGAVALVACMEMLEDDTAYMLTKGGNGGAGMVAGLTMCSMSPIWWSTAWRVPPGLWKKSRRVLLAGLAWVALSGGSRACFFPATGFG